MVKFKTILLKFGEQGEKTGWTYIVIPAKVANKLKPGNRQTFRVKGLLDDFAVNRVALMPRGDGDFIMPVNATMRKGIGKRSGAEVKVQFEIDQAEIPVSSDFLECLADEPKANAFFKTLNKSNQNYFIKWINDAKTEPTKAKRIGQALNALVKGHNFPLMLRALKADRDMIR